MQDDPSSSYPTSRQPYTSTTRSVRELIQRCERRDSQPLPPFPGGSDSACNTNRRNSVPTPSPSGLSLVPPAARSRGRPVTNRAVSVPLPPASHLPPSTLTTATATAAAAPNARAYPTNVVNQTPSPFDRTPQYGPVDPTFYNPGSTLFDSRPSHAQKDGVHRLPTMPESPRLPPHLNQPAKDGLISPSDGRHIFDLDGKNVNPVSQKSWLPSSFRAPIIPSHATASSSACHHERSDDEYESKSLSDEDSESIPLVSPTYSPHEQPRPPQPSRHSVAPLGHTGRENSPDSDTATSSSNPANMLPIPADKVFAKDAPPLYLPALDHYMSDRIRFPEPRFSDSLAVSTQEEKQLFGFTLDCFDPVVNTSNSDSRQKKRKSSPDNLIEVAGGQISCPAHTFTSPSSTNLRNRRKNSSEIKRTKRYTGTADLDDALDSKQLLQSKDDDFDDQDEEAKTAVASDQEEKETAVDPKPSTGHQVQSHLNRIPVDINGSGLSMPFTNSVPSKLSTASRPLARLQMFPPLMLLKDNTLDELKSNAIGPRKPPSGIWGFPILGSIFDMVIGVEGSTFAAELIRLELLRDFFQIMAAQLQSVNPSQASQQTLTSVQKIAKVLFQTIPSVLGLEFVSVFGYAIVFFFVWIVVTGLALWQFWRITKTYDPNRKVQGFDSQMWIYKTVSRGNKLFNTVLVFILCMLYLPLSKLAVDALVWSSDFWPVDNPYVGGNDHPVLQPHGNPDLYRDPLDFCYTTTIRKDAFNWAFVVVPLAALTFVVYTLWFPIKMMLTIKAMLPHVSLYNELGSKRSQEEMQIEYQRLLSRDKSPLNFLYNAYRRSWGFYKPVYILLFKFSNLVIIGVIAKDNCLFRSFSTKKMLVVQQIVLLSVMSVLLVIHLYIKPFVDPISNRSEMVSRVGYVLTAVIGLLVALNVSGSTVYKSTILYLIQGVSYSGNIYFAVIGTQFAAHQVKKWQSRVDFSIDIFSPLLDIQKHIKRRIWQETLSIIMLCGKNYHMPMDQVVAFSMSENDSWAPYLLDFQGSAAERHVENLKIVKQIGIEEYKRQVMLSWTQEGRQIYDTMRLIQSQLAGPDAYYRPLTPPFPDGVSSFFGKAFVIPFPPMLVFRYDQASTKTVQLTKLADLETFVRQNTSEQVCSRRRVRQTLRALEGQRVFCPYVENMPVGDAHSGLVWVDKMMERIRIPSLSHGSRSTFRTHDYTMVTPISYMEGTLKIERRQEYEWQGYNFASGFNVSIIYDQGGQRKETNGALTMVKHVIQVSGSRAFGLHDDFHNTPSLVRFFQDNEILIKERLPLVEKIMNRYRNDFDKEARLKEKAMSYAFLSQVFDNHRLDPEELRQTLQQIGCRQSLCELPRRYEGCITLLYERLAAINRSPVHRYWWLLFDEIWRQNSRDYPKLRQHRRSLSPQYPTSIAYRPIKRAHLERFLEERGLWIKDGKKGGPFNRGLLNRLYFYLNEVVFAGHHHDGAAFGNSIHHKQGRFEQDDDEGGYDVGVAKRGNNHPPKGRHRDQVPTSICVGLGMNAKEAKRRDFSTIDNLPSPSRPSQVDGESVVHVSNYTGGGTAYSIASIIDRSAYTWEQRLDGHATQTFWLRGYLRMMQWLNLQPVIVDFGRQKLYLFVKLVEYETATGKKEERFELVKESCTSRFKGWPQDGGRRQR